MPYKYNELPDARSWVRLIRIDEEPFEPDSDPSLWCHIEEFQIDSAPPYKALSYQWGSPRADNKASIYVEYEPLVIRKPLYKFLQRLAGSPDHDPSDYFFADAICMNQEDDDEKDLQVLLMGQVFGQAMAVYCWLGDASREDQQLLDALTSASVLMSRWEASRRMRSALLEMDGIYNDARLDVHNRKRLQHRVHVISMMYNFVRKSYFSRLWMAQEMILPKSLKLCCGKYKVDWSQLEHWLPQSGLGGSRDCILDLFGAFSEDEGISYDESGSQQIAQWRVQPPWEKQWRELLHGRVGKIIKWRSAQGRRSLVSAIEEFGFSDCERPRDRVWGLLGLVTPDNSSSDFPVSKNKSNIAVFFDTLFYCKAELGSNTINFAKKLYAMLELGHSAVIGGTSGSLPSATQSAIPSDISTALASATLMARYMLGHPLFASGAALGPLSLTGSRLRGFIAEVEQEEMMSRPSSRRLAGHYPDLWSFNVRPSKDLSAISINELMNLTIASAHQVTAITFDRVASDDFLFRVRGTMLGFICQRRPALIKGRYVVAKTRDTTAALRFLKQRLVWCEAMTELLDLRNREAPGALRGKFQISKPEDLLIFAADIEGGTYARGRLATGWGL